MDYRFARRATLTQDSFITEIFKYLQDKEVISFSGGFPNPLTFPLTELQVSAQKVFLNEGSSVLQYATTNGDLDLRRFISERYHVRQSIEIPADQILITSGSQQALDYIGKVFLEPGDTILIEEPSYLGAIQTFTSYEVDIQTVKLEEDGIDLIDLEAKIIHHNPKLIYLIPSFQNPSGISYSQDKRKAVAKMLDKHNVILIEDDPYNELYYKGSVQQPISSYLKDKSLLLGSFSKTISPGMRVGWVCASIEVYKKLFTAKEASDLHSSSLDQRILVNYLIDNDYDEHLNALRTRYALQHQIMLEAIQSYFPKEVKVYPSSGGMFVWLELPEGISSVKLFYEAVKVKVVFVPGDPFYVDKQDTNTLRLSFANETPERIVEGIRRLGKLIKQNI